MKYTGLVAVIVFVGWLIFGNPGNFVAGLVWPETSAPWENVQAFYYPDKNDLSHDERNLHVDSLAACRDWVHAAAAAHGDADLANGDYECGVGCEPWDGDMYVCRLTIR